MFLTYQRPFGVLPFSLPPDPQVVGPIPFRSPRTMRALRVHWRPARRGVIPREAPPNLRALAVMWGVRRAVSTLQARRRHVPAKTFVSGGGPPGYINQRAWPTRGRSSRGFPYRHLQRRLAGSSPVLTDQTQAGARYLQLRVVPSWEVSLAVRPTWGVTLKVTPGSP